MNKIFNKFLFPGEPGFTYSACETFTKNRERIQKYRKTDSLKHILRTN